MGLHDFYQVPNLVSLGVIVGAVTLGVVPSLIERKSPRPAIPSDPAD